MELKVTLERIFGPLARALPEAFVSSLTGRLHRQTSEATAVTMTTHTALFS
jgi:hypothetical protein